MKSSIPLTTLAMAGILTGVGCNSIKPTTVSASSGNTSPESHAPVAPAMNSTVNIVRNGFLGGYNTTTVGKAFEGTFQDAQWKAFETPKGVSVVEFTGTTTATGTINTTEEAENGCLVSLGLIENFKQLREQEAAAQKKFKEADASTQQTAYSAREQEHFQYQAAMVNIQTQVIQCERQLPVPVKFQFSVSADKTTFELTFIDPRPWKASAFMEATGVHYEDRGSFSRYVTDQGVSTEKILAFIYH